MGKNQDFLVHASPHFISPPRDRGGGSSALWRQVIATLFRTRAFALFRRPAVRRCALPSGAAKFLK